MNLSKNKNHDWELIFAMPNLCLDESFDSDYLAIVKFDDERLKKIVQREKMAEKLLSNFKTETGKQVKPSALICRKDAPQSIKTMEAVVAFRNALAISSLIHSFARSINSDNVFEPTCSDHFDFFPYTLNKEGNGLIVSTPATIGLWPRVNRFFGQTYPHIPVFDIFRAIPDKTLAEKILKQWRIRYISPKIDSLLSRLIFRSIEIAYQALLSPYRHSSLYEYGAHLSLWTSAFEILARKENQRAKVVGYKNVLSLLGKYRWQLKKLDEKRFRIYYDKKAPKGNLAQKLYKELYDARNDFFHGNPVTESRLFPFRNKSRPLLPHLAPAIYWTALTVFLPPLYKLKKEEKLRVAIRESWDRLTYMEAILSAIGTTLEESYNIRIGGKNGGSRIEDPVP
jgi:hypothetical protein